LLSVSNVVVEEEQVCNKEPFWRRLNDF